MKSIKRLLINYYDIRCMSCLIVILLVLLFLGCTHLEDGKNQSAKYIYLKSDPNAKIFVNAIFVAAFNSHPPYNYRRIIIINVR